MGIRIKTDPHADPYPAIKADAKPAALSDPPVGPKAIGADTQAIEGLSSAAKACSVGFWCFVVMVIVAPPPPHGRSPRALPGSVQASDTTSARRGGLYWSLVIEDRSMSTVCQLEKRTIFWQTPTIFCQCRSDRNARREDRGPRVASELD